MPGRRWQLFVDETGRFADPTCSPAVGGLLVEETAHALPVSALRNALGRAQPLATYPPHATILRSPSAQLAAWMLKGNPTGVSWFVHPVFERSEAVIRKSTTPAASGFLQAIVRASQPDRDLLLECDDELMRTAPGEFAGLRAFAQQCSRQAVKLGADIYQIWGRRGVLAVAAQRPTGALASDASLKVHDDQYLRILTVLLERVISLLREKGGQHSIVVRVSARDLEKTILEGVRLEVRKDHVELCAKFAAEFPWLTTAAKSVEFEARYPEPYDGAVHPGLVLADWIINRCAGFMNHLSWTALKTTATHVLGLPVEGVCLAAQRSLPALAASGPARDFLLATLRGEGTGHLEHLPTGWGRDQAQEWSRAGQALREVIP
jgi:hypothetical protein